MVKLRDTDSRGYGICPTSKKTIFHYLRDGKWVSNCQCSHYIKRRFLHSRWNPHNALAQFWEENSGPKDGDPENLRKALIKKFGHAAITKLESEKETINDFMVDELKAKLAKLRSINRALLRTKMY